VLNSKVVPYCMCPDIPVTIIGPMIFFFLSVFFSVRFIFRFGGFFCSLSFGLSVPFRALIPLQRRGLRTQKLHQHTHIRIRITWVFFSLSFGFHSEVSKRGGVGLGLIFVCFFSFRFRFVFPIYLDRYEYGRRGGRGG